MIRSLLCVPAHRPQLYAKACATAADCLMIDLEDSVPIERKDEAFRAFSSSGWSILHTTPKVKLFVRVNPDRFLDECALAYNHHAHAVVVPKVQSAHDVTAVADVFPGSLVPVIETPQAIVNLRSIVSHRFVIGCIFGVADYAAGLGVSDRLFADCGGQPEFRPWQYRFQAVRELLAVTCRAYSKFALDTCFAVKGDRPADRTAVSFGHARDIGFTGGACIHPIQVPVANRIFGMQDREIEWAQATAASHKAHAGEVHVDHWGNVVGMPVNRQAFNILGRRIEG